MPELPEVETVRRGLADRLDSFYINEIEVCRERAIASPGGSEEFIAMMKGIFVGIWQRRGKYLFSSLHRDLSSKLNSESAGEAGWWGVHLRMTGQFQWHEKPTSICPHTRVRFWNKEGNELRFVDVRSFGQMWWVPPGMPLGKIITGLTRLGPEPFSKDFNPTYLKSCLHGKTRPIKAALLDQSIVAGAGNIYADESLFNAGVSPEKPSGKLTELELERICKSLIEVLKISIGKGGTTFSDFRDIEGVNGKYGGQAWVYGRKQKPCRRCGEEIIKKTISGRSTHWCPNCQR